MNDTHSALYRALTGLDLVIVGGDARINATERLRHAFDLDHVLHCPTSKRDATPRSFERVLHGPRVVLAVWLAGLSRTGHGRQLHAMCRRLGIPWIDCFHVPHPHALEAHVAELRLLGAIEARRSFLLAPQPRRSGGAA